MQHLQRIFPKKNPQTPLREKQPIPLPTCSQVNPSEFFCLQYWLRSRQERPKVDDCSYPSPVLFCIYIDRLLDLLRRPGFGCFVGRVFLGALAYADDIVLLTPTHRAMRNMLALCDRFADE